MRICETVSLAAVEISGLFSGHPVYCVELLNRYHIRNFLRLITRLGLHLCLSQGQARVTQGQMTKISYWFFVGNNEIYSIGSIFPFSLLRTRKIRVLG